MKVIRHGTYYGKIAKFECKRCGCVFETDFNDPILETRSIGNYNRSDECYSVTICECPECGRKCQELEN